MMKPEPRLPRSCTRLRAWKLAAVALTVVGCGGQGIVDGTTSGGSTGASTSGAGGDGSTSSVASTSDASSSAMGSGGFGGGVMMPVVCSAQGGVGCADDEICDYPDNQCGTGQINGICAKRPKFCPPELGNDTEAPACGCDAKLHKSGCATHEDGTDLSINNLCATPAGTYPCGALFCTLGTQYCKHLLYNQGASELTSCNPLPGCGATCDCLLSTTCGSTCGGTPEGGIEVFCPDGG